MVTELLQKYIWLVQTFIRAGQKGLSLREIEDRWEGRFDLPYSRRTFNNHRDAVDEVFGEGTCRKVYGDILPSIEMHMQLFDELRPYFEEEAKRRHEKMNRYSARRTGDA